MTLTLELTPEQEARLNEAAQQQGIPPTDVLAAYIDGLPEQTPIPAASMTWGAQVLAQWERSGAFGLFADRPEDAPELARKLREEQQQPRYERAEAE